MIKLTKREAIRECKELWKAIGKSGLGKYDFLWDTEGGRKWLVKQYASHCPLCEYAHPDCKDCPLVTQYGKDCANCGFNSEVTLPEWLEAVRGLKD